MLDWNGAPAPRYRVPLAVLGFSRPGRWRKTWRRCVTQGLSRTWASSTKLWNLKWTNSTWWQPRDSRLFYFFKKKKNVFFFYYPLCSLRPGIVWGRGLWSQICFHIEEFVISAISFHNSNNCHPFVFFFVSSPVPQLSVMVIFSTELLARCFFGNICFITRQNALFPPQNGGKTGNLISRSNHILGV